MFVVAHNGSAVLGGGETGTALLLAGLQTRGHRVLMLCRDLGMAEQIAEFAGIPTAVLRIGGDAMLPDALRLAALLRRDRPDAVVLTTFKKVFLTGLGARLGGAPRVVQRVVLSGDTPGRSARYRFGLRHFVDVVALNADVMRPAFLAGDSRLDPARVVTIHDGVRKPARNAPSGMLRRSLDIPDGALVIGAVARLARQKRFDRLLSALALLPRDVHCIIAGEGDERDRLEGAAKRLGLDRRLHLLGFRTDIGDVLDAFDVFVVSSDREGMANAMLEAMAFGVPVVSTDVSGASEALQPFEDGTAPGRIVGFEAADLASALEQLIAHRNLRSEMAKAGPRRIAERFTFERMLDDWESLLTKPYSLPVGQD